MTYYIKHPLRSKALREVPDVNIFLPLPTTTEVLSFAHDFKFFPSIIDWQIKACRRQLNNIKTGVTNLPSQQPINQVYLDIVENKMTLITGNVVVNPWVIKIQTESTIHKLILCQINSVNYLARGSIAHTLNIMYLSTAGNISPLTYIVLNHDLQIDGNPLNSSLYSICMIFEYNPLLMNAKDSTGVLICSFQDYSKFFQRVFDMCMKFWDDGIVFTGDNLPIYITSELIPVIVDYTSAVVCKEEIVKPFPEFAMPRVTRSVPKTFGFRRVCHNTFDSLPDNDYKKEIMTEYTRIWGVYRQSIYDD